MTTVTGNILSSSRWNSWQLPPCFQGQLLPGFLERKKFLKIIQIFSMVIQASKTFKMVKCMISTGPVVGLGAAASRMLEQHAWGWGGGGGRKKQYFQSLHATETEISFCSGGQFWP